MKDYRNGKQREFDSERLKREILEKEALEVEQRQREELEKVERERIQRESLQKKIEDRKQKLITRINLELHNNFLDADAFFESLPPDTITKDDFKTIKNTFVREWFINRNESLGISDYLIPDDEQLEAISSFNGHIQVIARAGSGKTATLVNRALFLMMHCHVNPSSLLILAFNKKAATEVRRILELMHQDAKSQFEIEISKRQLGAKNKKYSSNDKGFEADLVDKVAKQFKVNLPHVMTFHALGYAIVHPEEALLYNEPEGEHEQLNRVFQSVIDDHLQIPEYKMKIRKLMLQNFKEDWDRIINGGFELSKQEFTMYKRSLPRESLRGEYVKSHGEKLIANFLFEHDITYKYERNYWWANINYRPDFTVFETAKSGIIIEYFGFKGDADYDLMSKQKRLFWDSNPDWDLIEFSPSDIKHGEAMFYDLIKTELEERGIPYNRLPEEEIWNRIHDRAIDRFTKAMVSFVGRCRKLSLTEEDLNKTISFHKSLTESEELFLQLAQKFYLEYLNRLSSTGEDDFDGLMQRAAEMVSNGVMHFHRKSGNGDLSELKYIFIDEFQDFTDLFYRLLCTIRIASPDV